MFAFCTFSLACSCIPESTLEESLNEHDFIFVGQCLIGEAKIEKDSNSQDRHIVNWTFEVQSSLKGLTEKKRVVIQTGIGFGDCGYQFKLGMSYLVFGHFEHDKLTTNICTPTKFVGFYPSKIEEKVAKEIKAINDLLKK